MSALRSIEVGQGGPLSAVCRRGLQQRTESVRPIFVSVVRPMLITESARGYEDQPKATISRSRIGGLARMRS